VVGVLPRWRHSPTTHRDTRAHASRGGIARTKSGPEEGCKRVGLHGPRRGGPKDILPPMGLPTASRGGTPFLGARRGSDFSPVADGTSSAWRLPTRDAAVVGRDVGARAAGRTSLPCPLRSGRHNFRVENRSDSVGVHGNLRPCCVLRDTACLIPVACDVRS